MPEKTNFQQLQEASQKLREEFGFGFDLVKLEQDSPKSALFEAELSTITISAETFLNYDHGWSIKAEGWSVHKKSLHEAIREFKTEGVKVVNELEHDAKTLKCAIKKERK